MHKTIDCKGRILHLDQPRICGIVNVTPDSFSDGGMLANPQAAIAHGVALVEQGADMLDVGGESTRPGAAPVDVSEELRRVIAVIEGLASKVSVPISIDTSKPEVMRAAVAAGAGLINDVRALQLDGALDVAAETGAAVCIMHMRGEPGDMQNEPEYIDVISEVSRFLTERVFACQMAGIANNKILIDPGFGFGKTLQHNLLLLAELNRLNKIAMPILVGLSRKSMIGAITGRDVDQRVVGSVAAAMIAVQNGAAIVRVHDVAATKDVLAVLAALPRISTVRVSGSKAVWDDESK